MRSASGPSFFTALATSARVVGQMSGQWVKPKNSTTALPRKSSRCRSFPFWSVSSSALPYSTPVMSVLLNFGPSPQAPSSAATASHLQIVVNEERRKQQREVDDRIAEGLLRDEVAVGEVDAQRVAEESAAERDCRYQVDEAAHAD